MDFDNLIWWISLMMMIGWFKQTNEMIHLSQLPTKYYYLILKS